MSKILFSVFALCMISSSAFASAYRCDADKWQVSVMAYTEDGHLVAYDNNGKVTEVKKSIVVTKNVGGWRVIEFKNNGHYPELPSLIFRLTYSAKGIRAVSYDDNSNGQNTYSCVTITRRGF